MERVRLVHGNGGRFSHELTERFILKYFICIIRFVIVDINNATIK